MLSLKNTCRPLFLAVLVAATAKADQAATKSNELLAPPLFTNSQSEPTVERSILQSSATTAEPLKEELPALPTANPEPVVLPPGHHAWARFRPGAWRREEIVSEAFDDQGQFIGRSVTQRMESLVSYDAVGYTLKSENLVSVGGRRVPGPTEQKTLMLLTDTPEAIGSAASEESTTISLDGKVTPCELLRLSSQTEFGQREESLHYSAYQAPHVLRRERRDFVGGELRSELIERVVRTNVPLQIGESLQFGWHTETTRTTPGGAKTKKFTVHSAAAPGGVVSESTIEYDASGRRVRWTVRRLLASGEKLTDPMAQFPPEADQEDPAEGIRSRRLQRLMRRAEEFAGEAMNESL